MRDMIRAPRRTHRSTGWLIPLALFATAAAVRIAVASQLPFPTNEGSAYYVGVARNIVEGDGLVSDAVWSYATPPLSAPKPAFELWLPMTSLVGATAMAVLGPTFWAAQLGMALLGALLAPLTWAVGRIAAQDHGLDPRRTNAVALAAGLLAALMAPFTLAAAIPDSYTPFVVFTLAAVLVAPRALAAQGGPLAGRDGRRSMVAGFLLGGLLGLAYLSRQEVIWLGLVVLGVSWVELRRQGTVGMVRAISVRLAPVIGGGLVVVVPWLMRNIAVFGSPFPGQALENAVLRRNEDIFGFLERPGLTSYLGQGIATVLGNPVLAAWDGLLNVLVLPAFPVGLAGILALLALRRSPALRSPTPLSLLILSGGLTFVTTVLLFPVATRWGTFLHASGPLLTGLAVMAVLGGDALLARISTARRWERPNIIVAPVALLSVAVLLSLAQAGIVARQSTQLRDHYQALASSLQLVAREREEAIPGTLITDHPMWLSSAVDRPAIALPDEAPASIVELARRFEAPWLVVIDERGRYPEALQEAPGRSCLARAPIALTTEPSTAWLFELATECRPA